MGVTDADVEAGLELHARLGAGDLKHRTEISPANLFKKATAYWTFKLNKSRQQGDLPNVLLQMMRSGKFFPAARWCSQVYGQGFTRERANTMWKLYTYPDEIDVDDIEDIFLTDMQPGPFNRDASYSKNVGSFSIFFCKCI